MTVCHDGCGSDNHTACLLICASCGTSWTHTLTACAITGSIRGACWSGAPSCPRSGRDACLMRSPIGRSYDNRIRGFSDQETSASHAPDTGPSAPPGKPLAVARVCVIRQGYYPLDVRVRREVRALTMAAHEVEVICLKERDDPGRKQAEGVRVHRIPIAARRGGQLRYLLEYAVFFLAAMMLVTALHFRRRFDLVQVHSMPDFLVFAAIVPRLLGARVLLDLHESMPEFYAVKFAPGSRHR